MSGLIYLIKSIFFLFAIILLANYVLKYLNRYVTKNSKNIQVIEKMPINKDSSLSIVCICGSYYLMSFTHDKNEIIKELSEADTREIQVRQAEERALQLEKSDEYQQLSHKLLKVITSSGKRKKL
ncbi:flagellar biosynthetic protein FliO [Vagococcus sp. BWB3-3]|uniref:Flagellar biosynthetic protein FliO n=1 Tax=Vagococcus allomyrinae TaxID=2794353 RepID=A0A940PFR3_9ENTE|nr:flagellar biosynthetic protein FliO [Vagococcus allomyrinae]MBP1042038.1 flagellar biosynthetic protein FliO [Vagococcus allomyrinae]